MAWIYRNVLISFVKYPARTLFLKFLSFARVYFLFHLVKSSRSEEN